MTKFTTDQIFETATTAEGMTKDQTVQFHLWNPNGLVAKLPKFDDFCHGDIFFTGPHMLYGQHENYHANWLRDVVNKPGRYTKWQLAYHINELADDIDRAWQVIAKKKAAA